MGQGIIDCIATCSTEGVKVKEMTCRDQTHTQYILDWFRDKNKCSMLELSFEQCMKTHSLYLGYLYAADTCTYKTLLWADRKCLDKMIQLFWFWVVMWVSVFCVTDAQVGDPPVAGFVTLQSPCSVLLRGQAAAVNHTKVYTQFSSAVIRVGLESCRQTGSQRDRQGQGVMMPTVQ